ncbi:malonate decarboxylase holo-[acyl-carrier-protein] synthase [Brucella intermedia]|uniref:malonate decarboxylase holo-[acyl-carrier-protein] synthase n=1 Tax=Brucella intermedia TaxID=94625 RepID=UPI002B05E1D6|nr:malonate decarboxylase holo-[acyl-carrier-protein] synthase [Brucella intermedia]
MMRLERHAFVRLVSTPGCGALSNQEAEAWRQAGLPFVVASTKAEDPKGHIRLGLATPDKRRMGFLVEPVAIDAVLPPPRLCEAMNAAPAHWQQSLLQIAGLCEAAEIEAAVFGSLAWTAMSGHNFLHSRSDLDLLLKPNSGGSLLLRSALSDLLSDTSLPFRLDGEIVLSNDAGVNIREYYASPSELLLKAHGDVRLAPRAQVDRLLQSRPAQ